MAFELDAFEPTAFAGLLDALLESAAPDVCVLAEIQPMEVLAVWTKEGAYTNVYSCTFSQYAATDVVPGGIYRRLDFVRQDATKLTSRASAALVDANLGSYYFDSAAAKLYLSTTTGASPETFALVGAWFSLLLSTDRVSFSDQPQYLPLITGTLPTLVTEKPDALFGSTIADQGELVLLNGDGLFDRLALQWVWRNKTATFKLGGRSLGYTDFLTIGTMRINTLIPDDEVCTVQLESLGSIVNRPLCKRTWNDGSVLFGTSPGEGVTGLSQPVVFGKALDCPLALIGTIAGFERYGYVDTTAQPVGAFPLAVYAINRTTRVRAAGFNISDYSTDGISYVAITNPAYPSTDYEFRADLLDNLAGSADGVTFGKFARQLLTRAGEDVANIDTAAFDAADLVATEPLGLFVHDTTSVADLLRRLEEQAGLAGGQVDLGLDGRWTCRLWDPALPANFALRDADFTRWQPRADDPSFATVLNEVRVRYAENASTGDATEATASSDAVQYANETTDSHTVPSVRLQAADATALAEHLRFLRSAAAHPIEFEERSLTLMLARVGDLIAVTRVRGPVARTGRLDGQLFEIVQLQKALAGGDGAPVVSGVVDDLSGQTDRVARYTDGSTPLDWSTATDQERAVYGFYADANGYVDAADPLSRHGKVAI